MIQESSSWTVQRSLTHWRRRWVKLWDQRFRYICPLRHLSAHRSSCSPRQQCIQAWERSDAVKMIMIKGSGEKAFSAGGDIKGTYAAWEKWLQLRILLTFSLLFHRNYRQDQGRKLQGSRARIWSPISDIPSYRNIEDTIRCILKRNHE